MREFIQIVTEADDFEQWQRRQDARGTNVLVQALSDPALQRVASDVVGQLAAALEVIKGYPTFLSKQLGEAQYRGLIQKMESALDRARGL